jgi:SAM-dependent methyltransferase
MPLTARWYTLLHAGNPGDIEFYLDVCSDASSVLELGAGVGRVSIPLVYAGLNVTAIENDKMMLDALFDVASRLPTSRREALRIIDADMRSFDLGRRFDRVVIPYNSLLCLVDEEDVLCCLRQVARHLEPDGLLIFDIYDVPILAETEDEVDAAEEHIATLDEGDCRAHVFEQSLSHSDPRRFDVRYRYQVVDAFGIEVEVFSYDIAQRCLYKEEIAALLARAGMTLVSITGDFEETNVNEDTLQLVVQARRSISRD